MRALPLGVAAERIGPSEVCALPLGVAAERSVYYNLYYYKQVGMDSMRLTG